ncbi:unnamed protein product [Callosobruchus maculatus]|uniref:Uncharacterized protein n=1 Tax=Callosobruchus maculatus TaxID=64391 RepID=A0A653D8L5_CALMS|nr:unnamed protein product [Callosobruchus maculatus]
MVPIGWLTVFYKCELTVQIEPLPSYHRVISISGLTRSNNPLDSL